MNWISIEERLPAPVRYGEAQPEREQNERKSVTGADKRPGGEVADLQEQYGQTGSSFNEAEERELFKNWMRTKSPYWRLTFSDPNGYAFESWLAARRLAEPELERKNELLIQTIEQLQKDKAAAEAEVLQLKAEREGARNAQDANKEIIDGLKAGALPDSSLLRP